MRQYGLADVTRVIRFLGGSIAQRGAESVHRHLQADGTQCLQQSGTSGRSATGARNNQFFILGARHPVLQQRQRLIGQWNAVRSASLRVLRRDGLARCLPVDVPPAHQAHFARARCGQDPLCFTLWDRSNVFPTDAVPWRAIVTSVVIAVSRSVVKSWQLRNWLQRMFVVNRMRCLGSRASMSQIKIAFA